MGIFIELVNEMNARRAHGEAAVRRATEELRAAGVRGLDDVLGMGVGGRADQNGLDLGIVQDVVKVVGHPGIGQLQLPAAEHPNYLQILPGPGQLVNAFAYGAKAQ